VATEEEIKAKAYGIWEQEGRPAGKDLEHYYRAKEILEQPEETRITELAPLPPVIELAEPQKFIPLPPSSRKRNIHARRKKR
jgi:hypothetical protein